MAKIIVEVINPEQTQVTTMQVPNDVPLMHLIDEMEDAMALPLQAQDGRWLRYHLNAVSTKDDKLKRLNDKYTLEENGVQGNSVLRLTVEMMEWESDELLLRRFARLKQRVTHVENGLRACSSI